MPSRVSKNNDGVITTGGHKTLPYTAWVFQPRVGGVRVRGEWEIRRGLLPAACSLPGNTRSIDIRNGHEKGGLKGQSRRTPPINKPLAPQSPPTHRPATHVSASVSSLLVRFNPSPAAQIVVANSDDWFVPGVSFLGTAVRTEYTYSDFLSRGFDPQSRNWSDRVGYVWV